MPSLNFFIFVVKRSENCHVYFWPGKMYICAKWTLVSSVTASVVAGVVVAWLQFVRVAMGDRSVSVQMVF